MAERARSSDGKSETKALLGDMPETPDHQGREGGDLARKTGTKADMRKFLNGSAGATRVTKSDEDKPGTDNLGERNK
ncbi:hypothetical protein [Hasllibacter sp. MH4015]|uniref:hypothetical protein n=1 Tax=Hasllibacter sp. MH4015 TaxID=2854029 RepID=UPI001CD1C806|nr:hypothetical protein [Hasllibacter sp. MH4015]